MYQASILPSVHSNKQLRRDYYFAFQILSEAKRKLSEDAGEPLRNSKERWKPGLGIVIRDCTA